MRVGLDIDNVITNFDKTILEECIKEDRNKRNTGIINNEAKHITEGMFDWSKEEVKEFFCNNMERIAKILEPREGAKYYMDKLSNDGHELYLISHRAYPHYNEPEKTTMAWLKKNNINYTKLVLSKTTDKSQECKDNKIDIMFDDSISNCKKLMKSGINIYLMETKYNYTHKEYLKSVPNWGALYNTVCDLENSKRKRTHVILDTDINNEADDQFALAYLLKSKDRIILDAVTIAPYSHENDISITEGTDRSYEVCKDIFNLCNEDYTNMIFKGSTDYFKNGYLEKNEAIGRMLDIIKQNDITYILAIGAITNIAVLLKLYPSIKNKIKVIWLGGHSIMNSDNREYNFRQDVEAVRFVYSSGVDLTIMPCKGVASNLTTSIYELQNYLNIDRGLGEFLYKRFYNDGIHGTTKRRVIWDISVIAYMINPYWFESKEMNVPIIDENMTYEFNTNKNINKIKFITGLNQNSIYNDLFNKIGGKI